MRCCSFQNRKIYFVLLERPYVASFPGRRIDIICTRKTTISSKGSYHEHEEIRKQVAALDIARDSVVARLNALAIL
jgi:hypothetical protein